jgi:hypothetical protein
MCPGFNDNLLDEETVMKTILLVFLAVELVALPHAFARGGMSGGMGSHSMGGALGTTAASPGTNSLGTAVPSGHATLVTQVNPVVTPEDKTFDRKLLNICKGC